MGLFIFAAGRGAVDCPDVSVVRKKILEVAVWPRQGTWATCSRGEVGRTLPNAHAHAMPVHTCPRTRCLLNVRVCIIDPQKTV
jgi:hypothetical protein